MASDLDKGVLRIVEFEYLLPFFGVFQAFDKMLFARLLHRLQIHVSKAARRNADELSRAACLVGKTMKNFISSKRLLCDPNFNGGLNLRQMPDFITTLFRAIVSCNPRRFRRAKVRLSEIGFDEYFLLRGHYSNVK